MTNKELQELLKTFPDGIEIIVKLDGFIDFISKDDIEIVDEKLNLYNY